ncbi:hypothetical protein V5T82_17940 [Magnetovibrio sp. PR-2]|uniref:hypothetical protein n=1 Tax=Magnetovibrio sp. PR-2 TaxID=3120356 RepID=UPI002FCE346F
MQGTGWLRSVMGQIKTLMFKKGARDYQAQFIAIAEEQCTTVRNSSWPDRKAGVAAAYYAQSVIENVPTNLEATVYVEQVLKALGESRESDFVDPVDLPIDMGCGMGTFMDILNNIRKVAREDGIVIDEND